MTKDKCLFGGKNSDDEKMKTSNLMKENNTKNGSQTNMGMIFIIHLEILIKVLTME